MDITRGSIELENLLFIRGIFPLGRGVGEAWALHGARCATTLLYFDQGGEEHPLMS